MRPDREARLPNGALTPGRRILWRAALADPTPCACSFWKELEFRRIRKLYCAVEIALYDLVGKAGRAGLGTAGRPGARSDPPLWQRRNVYDAEKYAEEALAISELGFRAYKMRPGIGPGRIWKRSSGCARPWVPDFELMVDAHTWWRMGDRNYSPAPSANRPKNSGDCRRVARKNPSRPRIRRLPALKELDCGPGGRRRPRAGRSGILRSDATEASITYRWTSSAKAVIAARRRLFTEIQRSSLKFAFHSWGTALEVIAAAQLGVCWLDHVWSGWNIRAIPRLARRACILFRWPRSPEGAAPTGSRRSDRTSGAGFGRGDRRRRN